MRVGVRGIIARESGNPAVQSARLHQAAQKLRVASRLHCTVVCPRRSPIRIRICARVNIFS
eukprot:scaffold132225_cov43-Attheya_sp.AAC.2